MAIQVKRANKHTLQGTCTVSQLTSQINKVSIHNNLHLNKCKQIRCFQQSLVTIFANTQKQWLIWLHDFTPVKPRVDSSLHNDRLLEGYICQNDHLKKMYLKEHDFLLKILLKFSKSLHSKLFFHVFPKEVFLKATVNMWRQYTACH